MLHNYLNPPNEEPRSTDAFISGKLQNASEVTSAKYIFSGIKDYEKGFIPVINHSKYSIYYTATVRAGIENTADIQKEITDTEVIITLPAAQILDVHIHPSSLRHFDKEDPLFHPNDREQVAKLLDIAEADAIERVEVCFRNLVETACERGILAKMGNAKRGAFYQAPDLIAVLEEVSSLQGIRRIAAR